MRLPAHKTKIVCTIGPASRSEAVLERLMPRGIDCWILSCGVDEKTNNFMQKLKVLMLDNLGIRRHE